MTFEGARFTGDRYQRLAQGAAVLLGDPVLVTAAEPFNSAGLAVFTAACQRDRVLDGLTDEDADVVAMLLLMNFHIGLGPVAECVEDVVAAETVVRQRNGRAPIDAEAVAAAVDAALAVAEVLFGIAFVNDR